MGKLCDNCIDLTGCDPISTDNILYLGPNLPCSTINTNDDLTTVIQKIDALLCFTPGAQDLQAILLNGNTATDIPIVMQTLANPTLITTLSFDGIKIEDSSSTLTLTTDSIIFGNNTTTLKLATPSVNAITLLLPDKPAGTYTLATIDEVPIDANLLHKTGDEIKTGNLTVNNIITIGGLPNEYLMADGTTSTIATIIAGLLTPNILDGDTTHAPTGDAVYDALFLKANLNSPAFTGNPTAPTPSPGDNDNSIATTSFVTDAVGTLDSNVVHLTGTETITLGTKIFTNVLGNAINVNMSNATGSGISISNTGSSNGLEILNSIGFGLRISNTSTGFGATISNSSSGQGLTITNSSSGNAFVVNGTPPATGFNFIGQNNGTATFTVDKLGNIGANSFTKSGGLASQFLKANGSVDGTTYAPDSTVLHITGNESWTGIKSSTNSGASQINGLSLINTGTSTSRVLNIQNQSSGYGSYIDNIGGGTGAGFFNQSTGFGMFLDNIGTGTGFLLNNASSGVTLYVTNQSTGDGIRISNGSTGYGTHVLNPGGGTGSFINNQGNGTGLHVQNLGTGGAIVANAFPAATGYNFIGKNNGADTFRVDKLGNIIANTYVKQGGTASQYLMADGTVTTAANITIPATQVTATPHADYLTGANVQLQLDNTETNVVGLYKIDKTDDKTLKQTGRYRPDTDVSVLSISPADTLNITACDNILFVNEILPDSNANKVPDFLKSFGNKSFVANGTNTPLAVNTRGIFYVGLNKLGTQVYQTAKIYDQDVAYLARILVSNTAGTYTIVSFKYFPDLVNNRINNRDRFVLSSGYIVPSGAASISFGNRGMSFTKNSINYSNNKLDPNYLTIADSVNPTPMSFLLFLPNITSLAVSIATSTVMDPTVWYTAGGAVGGGAVNPIHYQVYKLFITVTGTIAIQVKASTSNAPAPGVNAIFATREEALAGLTSTVFPDILPAGDSIALGTFYLRSGMAVNGSTMNDSNDFYFRPFNATASSSLVGVTNHDALSGKNDNPAFQHVTTTDITNWNTAYTNRITSLTTTGTSGAATLIANVLNIPIYAPGTGGTGYIQNQNASAQPSSNFWISGIMRNPNIYIFNNEINEYLTNTDTADIKLNYVGFNGSTTRFRDLHVYNGKQVSSFYVSGSTGTVGINTGSPVTNAGYGGLTLNGLNGGIFSFMVNGAETFRITNPSGYSFINTTGSTPLLLGTNATERMRITEGGNVGIGTTSPFLPLSVERALNGAQIRIRNIAAATDQSAGIQFSIADNTITTDNYVKGGIFFKGDSSGNAIGDLHFAIRNVLDNSNVSTSDALMTIKKTGNVGIGTTNPLSRLTIAGALGGTVGAGGANLRIVNTDTGNYVGIGAGIVGQSNVGMEFSEDGISRMVLRNGNLGVGTGNPIEKLTVESSNSTMASFSSNYGGNNKRLFVASGGTGIILDAYDWDNAAVRPITIGSNGSNLLVGTTTDGGEKLQVAGNVKLNGDTNVLGAIFSRQGYWFRPDGVDRALLRAESGSGDVKLYQYDAGAGYLRDTLTIPNATGNVLIGTSSDNGYKLRVNGSIYSDFDIVANGRASVTNILLPGNEKRSFIVSGPAPAFGSCRKFIRIVSNTNSTFISGKIKISGDWHYSPVMGVVELETGVYAAAGSGAINEGRSRLVAGTSKAYDNLSISDLMVVGGYVGFYIYEIDTNNIYLQFDGSIGGDTAVWDLNQPWESFTFPGSRAITFDKSVGIGTTNPHSRLHVSGGDIVIDNGGTGVIRGNNNDYGSGGGIKISSSNTGSEQYIQLGRCISGPGTFDNPILTVKVDTSNVLIGTTTDSGHKLNVNGRVKAGNYAFTEYSSGAPGVVTTQSQIQGEITNFAYGISTNAIGGWDYMANQAAAGESHRFWGGTDNNTTPRLLMKLMGNGNVLIGTTTDNGADKLQVNGSIRAQGGIYAGAHSALGGATGNAYNTASLEVLGGGAADTIFPTIGFHQSGLYAFTLSARSNGFFFTDISGNNRASIYAANIEAVGTVTATAGFFNSDARLKDVISRDGDVVKFKWKDGRDDKTHVGLIAQEVQEYMPDAVQEGQDGMLSVNYIEVLLAKITAMEKEIKELKSKIN